jgi:hypothetical protein
LLIEINGYRAQGHGPYPKKMRHIPGCVHMSHFEVRNAATVIAGIHKNSHALAE